MTDPRNAPGARTNARNKAPSSHDASNNDASNNDASSNDAELDGFESLGADLREGLHYARPVPAPGLERRAVAGAWLKMRKQKVARAAWFGGLGLATAVAAAVLLLRGAPAGPAGDDAAVATADQEHHGADVVSARPAGAGHDDGAPAPAPVPADALDLTDPQDAPQEPPEDAPVEPEEAWEADLAERERQLEERERQLEERERQLEEGDFQRLGDRGAYASELTELTVALERARQDIERLERKFSQSASRLSREEIAEFQSELRERGQRVRELERRIEQKAAEAARRASAVGEQARRRAMELEREAARRSADADRERQRDRVRRLQLRGQGRDNDWSWEWEWSGDDGNEHRNHNRNHNENHNQNHDENHDDHDDCGDCRNRGAGYRIDFNGNHENGALGLDVTVELGDDTAALLDGAAGLVGTHLGRIIDGDTDFEGAIEAMVEEALEEALEQVGDELEDADEDVVREVEREIRRELERVRREVDREARRAQRDAQREMHRAHRDMARRAERERERARRDVERERERAQRDAERARRDAERARRDVERRGAPDLEAYRRQVREGYQQRRDGGGVASARQATVEIQSDPPGATITINGRKAGTTPRKVALDPGTHSIVVAGANGVEIAREVTVAAGESLRIADDLR